MTDSSPQAMVMQSTRFLPRLFPIGLVACFCVCSPWIASAQSTSEAIANVSPKIVKIFGAGGRKNLYAYGSGFLVSPQGHIATVWSHILDGDTVNVVLHDGRRYEGRVLGAEPQLDLAVIKIDADDLPYFDITNEPAVVGAGARVLAFSNVFKVATGDEPVSVVHGVIAAKTQLSARRGVFDAPYSGPVYVVDAITNNSGAAGGVLTTRDGRLLGMLGKELKNNATHTWLNYVVPLSQLQTPIREIQTGKFAPRPKTGDDEPEMPSAVAKINARDFGLVMLPDVVAKTPAYIDRVLPGSAAEAAGLQSDDLILFVGDQLVPSYRALRDELARLEAGDRVKLVVRRGDVLVTVELRAAKAGANE